MTFGFQWNDGGKSSSRYPSERNCCTVIATAISLGIEFDHAYAICKAGGRRKGQGHYFERVIEKFPGKFEQITPLPSVYFFDLLDMMKEGTFVVKVTGHIFVVIDGTVHDTHLSYVKGKWLQAMKVWRLVDTRKTVKIKLKL